MRMQLGCGQRLAAEGSCHQHRRFRMAPFQAASTRQTRARVRRGQELAASAAQLPGPDGAFTPGQEASARQTLFNRIAPVYDEVCACSRGATPHLVYTLCPGEARTCMHSTQRTLC